MIYVFAHELPTNNYELLSTFQEHRFDLEQVCKDFREYLDKEGDDRDVVGLIAQERLTLKKEAEMPVQIQKTDADALEGARQLIARILGTTADDIKIQPYRISPDDYHLQTASEFFGVPLDEVTPLQRNFAKWRNFTELYKAETKVAKAEPPIEGDDGPNGPWGTGEDSDDNGPWGTEED